MDSRTPIDLTLLRSQFILPEDVTLLPVSSLDADVRSKIEAFDDDIALTRRRVRVPSKVIDADLSRLLVEFRTPSSISDGIARFCKGDAAEAEAVLEQSLPHFIDLIRQSILVTEDDYRREVDTRELAVGDRVDDFEVLGLVQWFADSAVYQVRDDTGRFGALKIAAPNADASLVRRIDNERRTLSTLPATVTPALFGSGEHDGRPWLIVDWIAGTLISACAAEIRERRDGASLQHLAVKVVEAFMQLHSVGIGHGDVHPQNVLVTSTGNVVLIDLGLAQHFESDEAFERGGVAFYADPEFARSMLEQRSPPRLSARSEQFSVAALVYEVIAGRPWNEFELEHEALYSAIVSAMPLPLTLVSDDWPAGDRVLRRALSPQSADRFGSLSEFAETLAAAPLPAPRVPIGDRKHWNRDSLTEFVDGTIQTWLDNPELTFSSLKQGPRCSLNGGAAGIAYALYRLACIRGDAEMLAKSERWIACAFRHRQDPWAYCNEAHQAEFAIVGAGSVHHGPAGISLVQALIALSTGDITRAELAVRDFLLAATRSSDPRDATLGRLSGVLGACELLACHFGHVDTEGELALWIHTQLDELWQEIDDLPELSRCQVWPNLGFAHGWTGLLYTTARVQQLTQRPRPDAFARRLQEMLECLRPIRRGVGIPWRGEDGQESMPMVGWCNGSAGLVPFFALMHELEPTQHWARYVENLAWHVWETPMGPVDLCCGAAGGVFALLQCHQLTGDAAWLQRAKQLACRAIERAPNQIDEDHPTHSLYKGILGLALAVEAVGDPEQAGAPMMGLAI